MNTQKKGLGRIAVGVGCGCLAGVALFALLAATSSDEPPAGIDLEAMSAGVAKWYQARMTPWPVSQYDSTAYSQAEQNRVQEAYLDVVREVGTEEFQRSMIGTYNVAKYMEAQRQECPEQVLLKFECEVMGAEFLKYAENGDALIRVTFWDGCTIGTIDADMRVVDVRKWDSTPVWDVHMRDTPTGWKIVSLSQREISDDLDLEQFGIDTPHVNRVVPAVDAGPGL